MNCPECNEKAKAEGGGGMTNNGRSRYYSCADCGIMFSHVGGVIRVLEDAPLTFKDRREAFRVIRLTAADERKWFDGILPETEELARLVIRKYLFDRRARAGARPSQQVSFGFSRRQGRRAA